MPYSGRFTPQMSTRSPFFIPLSLRWRVTRGTTSFRSRYDHARVRKPGRIMSASFAPNFRADCSMMSLSVSTLPPSARERAECLPGTLPVRCVVREQDGLHVKLRKTADRPASERHVIREESVWKRDLPLHALQKVADDHEPVPRRVQADAPRGMTGRVEDAQAAQDRQFVPFVERLSMRRGTGQKRDDRTG